MSWEWSFLYNLDEMLDNDFYSSLARDRQNVVLSSHQQNEQTHSTATTQSTASPLHMSSRQRRTAPTNVVDLTEDTPIVAEPSITNNRRDQRPQQTISPSQGRKRKRDEEPEVQLHDIAEKEPTPPPKETGEGNTEIGQMTCIICMEAFVNAATGQCGHMFCHECLTRALMASERHQDRGAGTCPTCRKPIYRKKANQVIPINFMKKTAYKKS